MADRITTAEVQPVEMARVVNNALAFLPARARTKTARLQLSPDGFTATASDTYAIGQDTTGLTNFTGQPATIFIERESLAELDKAGRADKKGMGLLELYAGDCLKFTVGENETAVALVEPTGIDAEVWAVIDDFMEKLESRQPALPQVLAFDPGLLMRFSKVKADKAERIADFWIYDNESPVLVKIGTTFRGAVMPINRAVHAANIGGEGLWES